jgi:hypothetical protein
MQLYTFYSEINVSDNNMKKCIRSLIVIFEFCIQNKMCTIALDYFPFNKQLLNQCPKLYNCIGLLPFNKQLLNQCCALPWFTTDHMTISANETEFPTSHSDEPNLEFKDFKTAAFSFLFPRTYCSARSSHSSILVDATTHLSKSGFRSHKQLLNQCVQLH